MNTRVLIAQATLLVVAAVHPNFCSGVDSNRAADQTTRAPEWASLKWSGDRQPKELDWK